MLKKVAGVSMVLGFVMACSAAPPSERLGTQTQDIVGGQNDTTHEAVVAVGLANGECSGTIIKTDPTSGVGWVLAAGHCIALGGDAQVVIQGDDITSNSVLQYQALSGTVHPSYDKNNVSSDHDFSVIVIAGVDATTPTMPIPTSTSDGVTTGSVVTSIGYGATSGGNNPQPSNTRKNVTMKISSINGSGTQLQANYSQSGSTGNAGVPCEGDSGGPVVDKNGVVVAVHSYGDTGCTQYITSDRVSKELTWINQQTATPPAASCSLCQAKAYSGKYKCAQLETACLNDTDCSTFNTCANACAANDDACVQKCLDTSPGAGGLVNGIQLCGCNDVCAGECKGDSSCTNIPKCGFTLNAGACTTFTEASCCTELNTAATDKLGFQCLRNSGKVAGCDTNPSYQALLQCQTANSACNGMAGGTGGGADGGTGGTGGTSGGGTGTGGSGTGGSGTKGDGTGAGGNDSSGGGGDGSSPTTTTTSGCSAGGSSPIDGSVIFAACAVGIALSRRRRRAA